MIAVVTRFLGDKVADRDIVNALGYGIIVNPQFPGEDHGLRRLTQLSFSSLLSRSSSGHAWT